MQRTFPDAQAHGKLKEVLKDIFFVTGTVAMPGPVPVRFSRNMTVIREGADLILVNSLRLDEVGLAALEKLGAVKHVIRLAGFHGMDDPFYQHRFGAKVWAVKGQIYAAGFNANPLPADAYFSADVEMDETTILPLADASLHRFHTNVSGEALLVLERHGGVIVSGDCLQNWARPDQYFSLPAKLMMRAAGFIKPHNLGPGWLKMAKPRTQEIKSILDLTFEHVFPAHGEPVLGRAKESFRKAIESLKS